MTASAAAFSIGPECLGIWEVTIRRSHFECRHVHSHIVRSGGVISAGDEK